jgi:predicted NBD/HSP70 family sugar kinase
VTVLSGPGSPARPQMMRALNEQMLLEHIRSSSGISRADLSRTSGLAKNTVSLALANLERSGLVRVSGVRTGMPGPAAVLYEIRPECGFVLGLDVGGEYLRGAVCDIVGTVRAKASVPAHATDGIGRVAKLAKLAGTLLADAGLTAADLAQTVLGSPGVYDQRRDRLALAGGLPGWEEPEVLAALRETFGDGLVIENDIDAAALAERAHGHGRDVDSFAFVSIGTGIGMGLVLGGRLHRGSHGAAGEIGYMALGGADADAEDARRRGSLEASASAAGIVRAAHREGMVHATTARDVFAAAARGDAAAARVVAGEALLIARAIGAVITVADPDLIVLGGGIGQAAGFVDAVARELHALAPVHPDLRVSALGVDAVVDGCLAAGVERAWQAITAIDSADT